MGHTGVAAASMSHSLTILVEKGNTGALIELQAAGHFNVCSSELALQRMSIVFLIPH